MQARDGGQGNNGGSSNSGPGNSGSNNNGGNCNGGCNNNNNNNNNNGNSTQIRLRTTLTGASIAGHRPEGNADFRNDNSRMRLQVEVENVNLPDGTVLTVSIIHNGVAAVAGTIMFRSSSNENELELDSQNGNMVPAVASGDMVTVSNAGQTIMAGVF
jgi:hypothetical protein